MWENNYGWIKYSYKSELRKRQQTAVKSDEKKKRILVPSVNITFHGICTYML